MIATAIMPGDPPAATCASPAAALRAGPGRRQAPPLPSPPPAGSFAVTVIALGPCFWRQTQWGVQPRLTARSLAWLWACLSLNLTFLICKVEIMTHSLMESMRDHANCRAPCIRRGFARSQKGRMTQGDNPTCARPAFGAFSEGRCKPWNGPSPGAVR